MEEHIGEGGFAKVTRRVIDGTEIAIKRIKWEHLDSAVRELIFIKSCSHECIIRIQDVEAEPECVALVMKFYPTVLTAYRARGPADVVAISFGLFCACEYIHQMGIIHSDIKCDNILVEEGPAPKPVLCDFGISLRTEERRHVSTVQTVTYRAPEVDFSAKNPLHSPTIDIWSIGVVLFRVVSGHSMMNYIGGCEDSSVYAARYFGVNGSSRSARLGALYRIGNIEIIARLLGSFGMNLQSPLYTSGVITAISHSLHPNPTLRSKAKTLADIMEKIVVKSYPEIKQVLGYRKRKGAPPSITIRAEARTMDELSCVVNAPVEVVGSCSVNCLNYAEMLYHTYITRAGVDRLEVALACIYMASATYCDSSALKAILTVMDIEQVRKYVAAILSVL